MGKVIDITDRLKAKQEERKNMDHKKWFEDNVWSKATKAEKWELIIAMETKDRDLYMKVSEAIIERTITKEWT